MAKTTPDKKMGRPTKMTEEVVNKLEYAFGIGCSVLEACCHAGISKQTYYNYTDENPDLLDRAEVLREKLPLQARKVIEVALNEADFNTAKWFLERKKKAEFSTLQHIEEKTEVEIKTNPQEYSLEDLKAMKAIHAKYKPKEEDEERNI